MSEAASKRRYGSDTSKTREQLLDAAQALMCESGYAAVTSRRLASQAGLKPALVYYYFPTMDELFMELFRRTSQRALKALDDVPDAPNPLKAMWDIVSNRGNVVLSYEFVGLANHRKDLLDEVARHGDRLRAKKIAILHQILRRSGVADLPFTASFATVLIDSLARNLALEDAMGVHAGHAEALETIERYFAQLAVGGAPQAVQAGA
jgi:AcrR family transcriptional regulator